MRDDEVIKKDMVDPLYGDDRIEASPVNLEEWDREVTLSGTDPGGRAREAAFDVARFTGGVMDVHNNRKVKSEVPV